MQPINGHNVSTSTASFPLSILRFEPGQQHLVWCLSHSIAGIYTHWVGPRKGGRSQYCQGDGECPSNWHKEDQIWKGYVSARVFRLADKKWLPTILEITEALHLDMRDSYQRGQIWQIGKKADHKKKYSTLQGKLHLPADGLVVPPADDIIPVLKWTYHTTSVDLTAVNRMPAKVMVTAEDGPDLSAALPQTPVEVINADRQQAAEYYQREKIDRQQREKEDSDRRRAAEKEKAEEVNAKFQQFKAKLANGFKG